MSTEVQKKFLRRISVIKVSGYFEMSSTHKVPQNKATALLKILFISFLKLITQGFNILSTADLCNKITF